MENEIDYLKYKDRLIDYARYNGINASENKNVKCFLPSHGSSDNQPSMRFKDDRFNCFKCNIYGDIYDLAGILHGTDDKFEQYNIVAKHYSGVTWTPPIKKEKSIYDREAAERITDFMRNQARDNFNKVLDFAKFRGYGEDFALRLGWWPGIEAALKVVSREDLEKARIPIPYKDADGKNKGISFKPAGIIFKYSKGWKLMYVKGGETIKRASWDAEVFGYPAFFDADKIVLVEAEISALAMNLAGIAAVSTGGINGLHEDNCEKLFKYKEIVFCFDADDAGKEAARKAAKLLHGKGFAGVIKIANIESREGIKDPDDYIKNGLVEDLKRFIETAEEYDKEIDFEELEAEKDNMPFKFLGFSDNAHYFLDRKNMITKISAGKATAVQLLEIAPLNFWKSIKVNKQGNPEWIEIIESVIAASNKKGPYKRSSTRGAGVWLDNGEVIASDGQYIFCKNGKVEIIDYKSKNTYIRRPPLGIDSVENKNHDKDFEFIKWMVDVLPFMTEQDGKLLFGWVISSIFLSVIKWRPIVYMKGPSGVGKSWIMNNVVREILDGLCICPNKKSTAVGIMQAPGCDSRMITVDELEQSSNKKIQELISSLINIARDTTTKSKESRYVGTADQEGLNNDFSSMFLFASIVEASEEDQDKNRITGINFFPKNKDKWPAIESNILYEFNNGLGERIRHGAIFHRESIVKNIFLFQKIAGSMAERQRNGDQLGTLIAGWYHLEFPGKVATEEEAKGYISKYDFIEQNERNRGDSFKNVLSSILSYKVRYEEEENRTDNYGNMISSVKIRERTIFEIMQSLKHILDEGNVDVAGHDLNKALMSVGIRYGTRKNPDTLVIALNHGKVAKMFPDDFSYKSNYGDYFKNYSEYICKENAVKFLGTNHQAAVLKIDLTDDDNIPF